MRIRTGCCLRDECSDTPTVSKPTEHDSSQSRGVEPPGRENDQMRTISLWLLAVGLVVCPAPGGGPVWAQDSEAVARRRPSPKIVGQLRQRLLRRFDENGNGRLDRRESQHAMSTVLGVLARNRGRTIPISKLPAGLRPIFSLFDRNRDGVLGPIEQINLSRTLSHAVRSPGRPGGGSGQPGDGDGNADEGGGTGSRPPRPPRLTPELLQRLRGLLLKAFDRNRNGRLDPPERSHARRVLLSFLSRHRGEEISLESAPPRLGSILGLFDFNGDGKLGLGENRLLRRALLIVLRPRPRPDSNESAGKKRPLRPRPDRPLGEELDDSRPDRPADGGFEVRPGRPPRPDF